MKVLITGSSGQVGSCLMAELSQRENVTLLGCDKEQLDITNENAVATLFKNYQPDVVINAAAYTAVDKAETEPQICFDINEHGPRYLAAEADKLGALMLHISTDYVFDGCKQGLYSEQDSNDPQSVYGKSKLQGERAVSEHCERYAIVRTAWVFGSNGNNFVKTMIRLAKQKPELGVVADQFGGPTAASDIANALIVMMDTMVASDKNLSGIYHFSGLPHVSWHQFATEVFLSAKKQGIIDHIPKLNKLTTSQYPTPAPRPENSRLDCDKIHSTFGIKASDWKRALSDLKAYS